MEIDKELIGKLRAAERVLVLTGAGISAESGVPTFRDAQSAFWSKFTPEELATPKGFARNPSLVWDWYAERRAMVERVEPNPGHHALARMEREFGEFLLATQNVDSLHQRAGSRKVVELHGNLSRVKCAAEGTVKDEWGEGSPPRCEDCGAYLRPDVVWFGESLPEAALRQAAEAAEACEVFFSIGTSSVVWPAAGLGQSAAARGAMVVEINPQPTPLTPQADHALQGPAGEVLPRLVKAVWGD